MTSGSVLTERSASRSGNGLVSVLVGIATHNRAGLLPKAIRSALKQTHRPLRVAVIDDGSTDQTPALRQEFANVSWERRDRAQGHMKARNRMMLSASEEYYVSLDDDAWFMEGDEVAVAISFLESHPSVAAVAFDILSRNRSEKKPRGGEQRSRNFIGCGHVLRLSVVKQLGGYAEFPGVYGCEEKDLCLRMIDAGYEVLALSGIHVWHDYLLAGRDMDRQYRASICNDLALALWRTPLLALLPALAWRVEQQFRMARRINCVPMCLKGIGDFARVAPQLWHRRRPVRLSSIARCLALPPPHA